MSLLGGSGALTGDIWSTGAFSFESPLKDLLDSKNYTLEQLLSEDELLQELRGLHPILTEYLSSEVALTKLVRYIMLPPSPPPRTQGDAADHDGSAAATADAPNSDQPSNWSDDKNTTAAQRLNRQLEKRKSGDCKTSPDPEFRRIRFPYMACEIICCELDGIIATLVDGFVREEEEDTNESATSVGDETSRARILDVFFGVLYDTPPGQLDDYRAGYFEKILSLLFRKKPVEMSTYINSGGDRGQKSLMEAMMKHLYSNSVMQILQRLLLPPRPKPQQAAEGEDESNNTVGAEIADGDADDQAVGGQDILAGEEEDGEAAFTCDWPSSGGLAIDMLLQRLINPDPLLQENEGTSPILKPLSAVETDQSMDEQRLNMSLNASEVLITVIQNSMLSSETMLYLTSLEPMQRLVVAATSLRDETTFPLHESLVTSAMNVVESVILQLGGYGAVGTMAVLEPAQEQEVNPAVGTSTPTDPMGEEPPEGALSSKLSSESNPGPKQPLIADLTALLHVLPELLYGFSNLLRHPSTKEWTSPLQFSQSNPVQLLGTPRLRIVRVLESLVLLGDPVVDSNLVQSDCLAICLDLFWEFQWCSMLHQSVANLLVHVFEGQSERLEIQAYFICRCNLIARLLDSFVEVDANQTGDHHGAELDYDGSGNADTTGPKEGESNPADVLPVSEDDIDAAMEKQQEDEEKASSGEDEERKSGTPSLDAVSTEAVMETPDASSMTGIAAPAQAFRYGYMGHVIIVSQALVQACAGSEAYNGDQASGEGQPHMQEGMISDGGEVPENPRGMGLDGPIMIADLVTNHELFDRWQSFVETTLASEITVQSTPLGGMSFPPSDPLQAARPEVLGGRRPGLADDGDIGDGDGAMAPLPPRGMLTASDINDIDERDLEVAASMMAGLTFGRPSQDDGASVNSGDSERSYNSGETAHSGGYLFDDPLGQAGGSLGIELGRLTQYKAGESESNRRNMDDSDGEGDEDHSSSDEEETPDPGNEDDVPVMDLFAGNFNYATGGEQESPGEEAAFDFANFDNVAFDNGGDAEDAFGDFTSASAFPAATLTNDAEMEGNAAISDADDIFGSGSNSSLLDDLTEANTETQPARPEPEYDGEDYEPPASSTGAEMVVVPTESSPEPEQEQTNPQTDKEMVVVQTSESPAETQQPDTNRTSEDTGHKSNEISTEHSKVVDDEKSQSTTMTIDDDVAEGSSAATPTEAELSPSTSPDQETGDNPPKEGVLVS